MKTILFAYALILTGALAGLMWDAKHQPAHARAQAPAKPPELTDAQVGFMNSAGQEDRISRLESDVKALGGHAVASDIGLVAMAENVNLLRSQLDDEISKEKKLLRYLLDRERTHTICISNILWLQARDLSPPSH